MQELTKDFGAPVNLPINRKPETQYFHMQTEFIHIGFDGKRTGVEIYLLRLVCTPAALSGKKLDEYTCSEFGLKINSENLETIPCLKQFSYQFNLMSGVMDKGPVFGIPHEPFEGLTDNKGNKLPADIRYAIYNNFIDFHSFNDIFSVPMNFGKGIQDLKLLGDKIVHASAFTEAPVTLGNTIKPGSVFHNGKVSLELKGISMVDGKTCALVGYDSGESTLKMLIQVDRNQEAWMEGGSEYRGDMYIDLDSGWARKVTLDENVITQAGLSGSESKTYGYTVRHILLRLISKDQFQKPLAIF